MFFLSIFLPFPINTWYLEPSTSCNWSQISQEITPWLGEQVYGFISRGNEWEILLSTPARKFPIKTSRSPFTYPVNCQSPTCRRASRERDMFTSATPFLGYIDKCPTTFSGAVSKALKLFMVILDHFSLRQIPFEGEFRLFVISSERDMLRSVQRYSQERFPPR